MFTFLYHQELNKWTRPCRKAMLVSRNKWGIIVNIIYQAKSIRTMNPHLPHATHIAVRDGHILGVGTVDDIDGWQKLGGRLN